MTEFKFTNDHSPSQIGNIIDVLRRPRLWIPTEQDYPNHDVWLDRVEAQVLAGTKRAMLAYHEGRPVGAVVYQRHTDRSDVLEIKNISVDPEAAGRYVGSFLLHNSVLEAEKVDFPGVEEVTVDTKQTNRGMIKFLLDHEYVLQEVTARHLI